MTSTAAYSRYALAAEPPRSAHQPSRCHPQAARRIVAPVVAITIALVALGCSAGKSTTAATVPADTKAPASTAPTTVLATTTTLPPAAPATAIVSDAVGNKVEATFYLSAPMPLTAEPPAVQNGIASTCFVASPNTTVVVMVTGTISVLSSLPAAVGLAIPRTAYQYSDGVSCNAQYLINYPSIAPGQPATYTAWIITDAVISPNNPSGAIGSLAFQPRFRINDIYIALTMLKLHGPRVVGCGLDFATAYYVVVSPISLPKTVEQLTCTPAPNA